MEILIAAGVVVVLALVVIAKTAIVVPQQNAYVVEYLGKYRKTMQAGFPHSYPFRRADRIQAQSQGARRRHPRADLHHPGQRPGRRGRVLYMKVLDAQRASYGIGDFIFAISQLAQTTLRSEIGKIDLDRTFEERGTINVSVVMELDKASDPWGVKVLRYEIKNINPPQDVLSAMEKQMRAEREKRAVILTSEGERDAKINEAEGGKQQVIKESEASKQQKINEAEGEAEAILTVATATAEGLRRVADALQTTGGDKAMQLRIAEQYIEEFGRLAKAGNTFVVPSNLSDIASMIALATGIAKKDVV